METVEFATLDDGDLARALSFPLGKRRRRFMIGRALLRSALSRQSDGQVSETDWRFMRLWTLKEAVAKRMGTGFATEFSEIDTTDLPIIDGPDRIASCAEAEPALRHLCLTLPEGIAHVSISTAPVT